jgi:DNA-binding NtrC family response regulator
LLGGVASTTIKDNVETTPNPTRPILILDDDDAFRSSVRRELYSAGINNIVSLGEPDRARELVASGGVDLVLLDLKMPGVSGEQLLSEFVCLAPHIPIIIVTGSIETDTTVRCIRAGALDYIVKPIETARLLTSIWNGLAVVELRREMNSFRESVLGGGLSRPELFSAIVTADERMIALFQYIEAVAPSRQPVLITGETGTGKELFARAVHAASERTGAFVAVNVAGLDDSVFTDSLFGHKRGAYTGAEAMRSGLVSEAKGGTLFLDEIGDLDAHSQVKLLRLLQEGEYYPLGSDFPFHSEARIVAATTRDLEDAVAKGTFRADLFYRLHTHPIEIPPLRKRRGDIPILTDHFLELSARDLGIPEPELPRECRDALASYDFPGNVRELEGLIHDAVAGSRIGKTYATALLERLEGCRPGAPDKKPLLSDWSCSDEGLICISGERFPTLREAENELVGMALARAKGNTSLAASMLGISRQTIYKWRSEVESSSTLGTG